MKDVAAVPFEIAVPDAALDDLRDRLRRTRYADDFGNDGRWIPTTSLEQFAAPMLRWYGMSEGDLSYILPNIGAFPTASLGFMA